uniref:Uncharacterized protein n=1 Tax=viral metagenome TaxID=1070528 RepID=A0A6C0C2K2_9ZZZZ
MHGTVYPHELSPGKTKEQIRDSRVVRDPAWKRDICRFTPTYRLCSPHDIKTTRLFFGPKETLQCCSWLCSIMPRIHSIIAAYVSGLMKSGWKPRHLGKCLLFSLQVLVRKEGIYSI